MIVSDRETAAGTPFAPTRRDLIAMGGASILTACGAGQAGGNGAGGPPNIVFILADDLGYADLSCYGRRDFETPNIDKLASQGVRYLDAYSNSPVCSPTRTALITGNYQYRLPVGLEEPLASRPLGLPPGQVTLPSILRDAGYNTALVGKWHLGQLPDYGPLKSGYEHFWGFRGGGIDYFTHAGMGGHDLWDQALEIEREGYLTDLLGQKATEMIEQFSQSDRPFFLSLHFNAPHWPWEGAEDEAEAERIAKDPNTNIVHWDGGGLETYANMVRSLDLQVGRVMQQLDRLGLSENTILVFTSDNGGERFSDTWPFSGRKTELLEGGIRVPCIVRWPRHLPPGAESRNVSMSMDWAPTLIKACGIEAVSDGTVFDGVDVFAPDYSETQADRALFWRMKWMSQEACRHGKWKYLRIGEHSFLFDLETDPLERANLKHRHPDLFQSLETRFRQWDAAMLPISEESESHGYTGAQMADRYGAKYPD
jgi:arylsulfatase A-like enzyme